MNNKLHAGLYNTIIDQAADHFTGIPIKWDYDITEQRKSILQKMGSKVKTCFQGMSEMRQKLLKNSTD